VKGIERDWGIAEDSEIERPLDMHRRADRIETVRDGNSAGDGREAVFTLRSGDTGGSVPVRAVGPVEVS